MIENITVLLGYIMVKTNNIFMFITHAIERVKKFTFYFGNSVTFNTYSNKQEREREGEERRERYSEFQ